MATVRKICRSVAQKARAARTGDGVDQDRHGCRQEHQEDRRAAADAEPDDDQREQRDARRGIKSVDQRVQREVEPPIPADGDAQRHADEDGQHEARQETAAAEQRVALKFAG
jgi:hypothetical protein